MKNKFDFRRFIHVLWYTWISQSRIPYLAMVVAMILASLFLSMNAHDGFISFHNEDPFLMFNFYFFGCGWLNAALMFHEFSKNSRTGFYLLLPASVTEKWLAKVLLAFIVFPVILCGFFHLGLELFNAFSARAFGFRYPPFDWSDRNMLVTFFFFWLTLPAAFSASLIWKRFGFFKGIALTFVVFTFLFFFYLYDGSRQPLHGYATIALISEVNLPFFELDCPPSTQALVKWFWILAGYIPSLLFFASTWFFLKEKEI